MTLMFMQAYPEAVRATLLAAVGEGQRVSGKAEWLIVRRESVVPVAPVAHHNWGELT